MEMDKETMMPLPPLEYCGDIHASEVINAEKPWVPPNDRESAVAFVILLYGSWNNRTASTIRDDPAPRWVTLVQYALSRCVTANTDIKFLAASVRVDADDESTEACAAEVSLGGLGAPSDLPAILIMSYPATSDGMTTSERYRLKHVHFNGAPLESLFMQHSLPSSSSDETNFVLSVGDAWSRLFDTSGEMMPSSSRPPLSNNVSNRRKSDGPAIRIFIAGDRSQVGKSSICLGLLGSLLNSGKYTPDDLAYIKPATQCEQTQLVEEYCKYKGITACVPVGPIVYYKGFTRAFLKGETGETSDELLQKASHAVDKLALNKKVVIIDGVGYPSVGSITGTDNASVAKVCGRTFTPSTLTTAAVERSPVPVLLIGKSGVGDAVDSFNINATYFTHKHVPVIGAIFNKLCLDGFYSLANCKEAIDLYFGQFQPDMRAFGYIPEIESLKNSREHIHSVSSEEQLQHALKTADLFVEEFVKHVNVDMILEAAANATEKFISEYALSKPTTASTDQITNTPHYSIHQTSNIASKLNSNSEMNSKRGFQLSREQIEASASAAGAAGA
ncbi:hypothetical protein ACHAWU_005541 [Discostella pseudostelligera]|uniref:Uncharacterized protein n=1 Tax=Discostella pseudostelligera TaxID=259834 RepID=A0ABD3N1T0_9STRA